MSLYPPLVTDPVKMALRALASFHRQTGRRATRLHCGPDAYMDLKAQVGVDFVVHGERIAGAVLVEDDNVEGYVPKL